MERCGWVTEDPLYRDYHDREWGVPSRGGRDLWEQLTLEGFQSGLSWLTILRKREGFRDAFAGFEPTIVARWGEAEIARLQTDARIVRHRGKIEATILNARAWLEIEAAGGFSAFVWDAVDGTPIQGRRATLADIPARTPASASLSKRLKSAGFRFCGPTTTYAFMQAAGLVNDHVATCHRHAPVAAMG